MLKRNFRLKKESDFKRIYRKGKRIRGNFFDVTYLENRGGNRFGIVATTKIINFANKRNLAKRLLRSYVFRAKNLWPQNIDMIIKIKKEIENKDKKAAEKEINDLFIGIKK